MSIAELLRRRVLNTSRVRSTASRTKSLGSSGPLAQHTIQRAMTTPHKLASTDLVQLQRMLGNQQVSRMLKGNTQGSGLKVGATYDVAEHEASDLAAQVAHDSPEVQRALTEEDEGGVVSTSLRRRMEQARCGGSPAPESVRRKMEAHTGADFSQVRVHHNQEADAVNEEIGARAATYGKDIFLARNESPHDVQLMAHEMTHTIQQGAVKGGAGMIGGQGAKHVNTIQRAPNDKKIKKLKLKRFLAKLGGGAAKLVDTLVTLPLQVIDQLSVLDLHAKDFGRFLKSGFRTRKKRQSDDKWYKDFGYDKGTAKRKLGRTGLSGYIRGLNSHNLTYDVGESQKLPWFKMWNPFATSAKVGGILKNKEESYSKKINKLSLPQQRIENDDSFNGLDTTSDMNSNASSGSKTNNNVINLDDLPTQMGQNNEPVDPEALMILQQLLSQSLEEDQQNK